MTGERVAAFRPADERMAAAVAVLQSLDVTPVADPLLTVEPTGAVPRSDADFLVLTSKTGAELLPDDWTPGDATVCAIGEPTAQALAEAGFEADVIPETYSSSGLADALEGRVDGARVEIARSDHGSPVLRERLDGAGAYHHETVLYRLIRPPGSGDSTEIAAAGELDAALFTSSLTVEHFLEAARERGIEPESVAGLEGAVVGAIGDPTRETAEAHGVVVDVVPGEATFEALSRAVVDRLRAG